jgi:hypothetical protein
MDDTTIARAINLFDAVEQDMRNPKESVVYALALSARAEAIDAMRQLLTVGPFDGQRIAQLQAEVRRYAEMGVWLREVRSDARDAFNSLDDEERQDVIAFLSPPNEKPNDA